MREKETEIERGMIERNAGGEEEKRKKERKRGRGSVRNEKEGKRKKEFKCSYY